MFQRADRTYFDEGHGPLRVACCVQREPTCAGCRNEDARTRSWCQPSTAANKSSTAAGVSGIPATTPCSTSSACGRSPLVLEHGEAALIRALQERSGRRCSTIIRGGSSGHMICPKTERYPRHAAEGWRRLESWFLSHTPEQNRGRSRRSAKGGDGLPFLWECVAAFFRREAGLLLFQILSHWMMPKNTHAADDIQEEDR